MTIGNSNFILPDAKIDAARLFTSANFLPCIFSLQFLLFSIMRRHVKIGRLRPKMRTSVWTMPVCLEVKLRIQTENRLSATAPSIWSTFLTLLNKENSMRRLVPKEVLFRASMNIPSKFTRNTRRN